MKLAVAPRRYCATSYGNVSELVNNAGMYTFALCPVVGDLDLGA